MKNVDMYFEKRTYGSRTKQCYSYATCASLSKADANLPETNRRRDVKT